MKTFPTVLIAFLMGTGPANAWIQNGSARQMEAVVVASMVEPAAAAPVGSLPAQVEDTAPISLQLDNADIYQVIRIIGDALGLNYVIDPAVQGTVNINTGGTLQRSDLLPILETILRINGATIIQTGNFYQIVPATAAVQQPLPVLDANPGAPIDDQFVLQIIRMRYVSAAEIGDLLVPYLSEGANVVIHDAGNVLLVTERRGNLRKLLDIIDIFDTNVFEGERVRLFPVENNRAADLVTDLQTIFSGYALSDSESAIRFVAIERLNSILVVTPNPTVFEEVESWLDRLDQPIQRSGVQNFVYKVQNGRAANIQQILGALYGATLSPSFGGAATNQTTGSTAFAPQDPVEDAGPGPALAVQAGDAKIIADQINNSLVIQATPQVFAELRQTILELDTSPRQVLIDAQIYEVVLDDSLSFGISATLQNRGTLAEPQTTASFAAPAGGGIASFAGQTFTFIGRMRELVLFLNASENRSRVRTLSAPSILASDNFPAEFQVGAEIPIPTSSSVTPVQADGTNLFAQTIQFRNTGVLLNVTPHINDGGNVTLEIDQEISQAGANSTSGIVAPVIGKSSVSSTIVVRDGQTIALGGFIRESQDVVRNRVPILGRIPGLGALFGNTSRSNNRTELIILVTPHVIRTTDEADLATVELREKLEEIQRQLEQ